MQAAENSTWPRSFLKRLYTPCRLRKNSRLLYKRCCNPSGVLLQPIMNLSPPDAPALLNSSLQRLAAQSASCKLWSIILTSLVLVMAAGRAGAEVLLWAAAPSLLLALADAAYCVKTRRIATLAAKETVRAEDLFRMQSGSSGFSTSIQSLSGLASFSVWPFYTALTTMVIVLGQTVLVPHNPPINGSPYQPNTPRPAYSIQQSPSTPPPGAVMYPGTMQQTNGFAAPNGAPQFQPPPNQITVTRPNMPPMGVSSTKPNAPETVNKSPTFPGSSSPKPSSLNRPTSNTFPPKTAPAPYTTQNSLPPKPAPTPTQHQ